MTFGNLYRLATRRSNRHGLCRTIFVVERALHALCELYNINIECVDFDTGCMYFDLLAELHSNVSTPARIIEIITVLLGI